MTDPGDTQELRIAQVRREHHARDQADRTDEAEGVQQAARRADKAAYLKDKLAEREESERRAEEER